MYVLLPVPILAHGDAFIPLQFRGHPLGEKGLGEYGQLVWDVTAHRLEGRIRGWFDDEPIPPVTAPLFVPDQTHRLEVERVRQVLKECIQDLQH